MENKQTSVEWLQECLSIHLTDEQKMQFEGLFQQALAMEKEQIERMYSEEDLISAFEAGMMFIGEDKGSFREWFEQFKKGEQQ